MLALVEVDEQVAHVHVVEFTVGYIVVLHQLSNVPDADLGGLGRLVALDLPQDLPELATQSRVKVIFHHVVRATFE